MVVVTGKNTLAPEFIVSTDTGLDGVLQVSIIDSRAEEEIQQQQINDASDSRGGTAALLYTGKHILHCKHAIEGAGYGGHTPEDKKYWYIFAEGPEGKVSLEVEKVEAYRSNGELEFEGSLSYDFSIITLKEEAPTWIDRYEIYRETDEIGKNYLRVGYGMEGLGEYGRGDGFLPKEFWSSDTEGGQLVKRYGSNTYDMTEAEFLLKPTFTWDAESLGPLEARQAMLMSDFDDGTVENDAFGQGNIQEMKNVKHTGLGKWEVSSSPGNSGGPNFIDGRIAGVGSGGGGDHPSGQLIIDGSDDRPDGYGWYTNDSRVSSVIDWIEGIVGKNDNTSLITLPGTMVNDNLKTTGGPNKFYGYAGDDIIAGGDKEDIAGYRDVSSNYTITKDAKGLIKVKHTSFSVNTIDDGTDTLTGIEKLKFTDQTIETSSINNIDDSIYSREGTFLGNNYTIKMLGDNEEEIYAKGTGNAFVVGRDVFSEEQVKGILDNYEYVIKSISKTLSWKGTLDFVVVVQGDTGHPTGLLPSIAFQHGEDLTGEAGVLLGTNEDRVHVATYEQLTGIDLNGDEPDLGFYINVTENNEFKNFDSYVWIDPAPNLTSYSNLPEGQHDLISIITHEITHAMGLAGTLDPYWSVNHYSKSLTEKDGQYYYSSERITNLLGKDLYTEYEAGRSDDDSLDHHVLDPEGGISGIASLMSGEMYSQRWSEPGPIEYAILYDSGWTERTTGKLSETINSDHNVLQAHSENTLSGTLNFNAGDNIVILDGQGKNYRGLSGDDTYFVSQLIPKNTKLSITDTDGTNIIQVPANTYVDKSLFTKNAARLTLEDGREITINSADKFSYNIGGNVTNGTKGTDLTFSEFAEIFGVYDILDSSGAQTGALSDLYII